MADDMGACGIAIQKEQTVYNGYDNDCEYSRLQLRKKQSRFINHDGTQKAEYTNQDEEEYVPLNLYDITSPPPRRAYTFPRICRVDTDNEENAKCSNDIIRCTSEGQLMKFQKDSLKPLAQVDESMSREIIGNDAVIEIEERPYSLVRF
jgi:hypothetical protein